VNWLSKETEPTFIRISGDGNYPMDIVGEANYQSELDGLTGGKTEDGHHLKAEAMLILEDSNPYDDKAVAVSIKGDIVGYLSRQRAREHRDLIGLTEFPDATTIVNALITGGWRRGSGEEGHYGVKLDMPIN